MRSIFVIFPHPTYNTNILNGACHMSTWKLSPLWSLSHEILLLDVYTLLPSNNFLENVLKRCVWKYFFDMIKLYITAINNNRASYLNHYVLCTFVWYKCRTLTGLNQWAVCNLEENLNRVPFKLNVVFGGWVKLPLNESITSQHWVR